jgi:hypothetical protein
MKALQIGNRGPGKKLESSQLLKSSLKSRNLKTAGHRWLTPIILATQEAEIKRITVQSQPGQIVCETLSQKTLHKNRAGGVAQGEGPELKPQYLKKRKRNLKIIHFPQQTL